MAEPSTRCQCEEAETKEKVLFEKNEGAGLDLRDKPAGARPSAPYTCAVPLPVTGLPCFRLSGKGVLCTLADFLKGLPSHYVKFRYLY